MVSWYQETKTFLWVLKMLSSNGNSFKFQIQQIMAQNVTRQVPFTTVCLVIQSGKVLKTLSGFVMRKHRIVIDSVGGGFLAVWPLCLIHEMFVFMRIFSLKLCIFLTQRIFYVKINITELPGHKKFSWKMSISESHSLLYFLCVSTLHFSGQKL